MNSEHVCGWTRQSESELADDGHGVVVQPILATKRAADLALKHRLPSMTTGVGVKTFPEVGGRMSYGANPEEFYQRAALYVDKILKGARPAHLAVEQPTRFQLVINLKTANALGLAIPPALRLQASQVIE
jgi:putative ABC transport system substrate-binding protein